MSFKRTICGVELTFAANMKEWRDLVMERANHNCELHTGPAQDAHHLIKRADARLKMCVENGFAMTHQTHMRSHFDAKFDFAGEMEHRAKKRFADWEMLKQLRRQMDREQIRSRDL